MVIHYPLGDFNVYLLYRLKSIIIVSKPCDINYLNSLILQLQIVLILAETIFLKKITEQ